jgi:hypothetical protein
VRTELTRLRGAEFLYEVRLFPDLEYTFKHALTHEVAYKGLLHDRRRALHARILPTIERLSSERIAEQAERLAHHALRGGLWEKAVGYLRQAGFRAMARGANREAVAHLEQALEALSHLPVTQERTELAIDIRIDMRSALNPLGDWTRMGELLQEAEMLARSLSDQRRLGRIATFMAMQWWVTAGDYDEALRFGQERSRSRAHSAIARSRWSLPPTLASCTSPGASSTMRQHCWSRTSHSRAICAASVLERASSSWRTRGTCFPACSPSSAGSMRPLDTPRRACGSLRRPIIPSRCTMGCITSAQFTCFAGIFRERSRP